MAKNNIKKASGPEQAFDCICGNEIRAQLEKNDRTQKEGQMRALMEQMQRLTK